MPRKQAQQHGSSTESTRGVSPPSGTITIQPLDVVANPRKRKVSALTPDNADIVLSSCLDISRLIERLNEEQEIFLDANKEALIAVMKQCVKDPKVNDLGHCSLGCLTITIAERWFLECYTATSWLSRTWCHLRSWAWPFPCWKTEPCQFLTQ